MRRPRARAGLVAAVTALVTLLPAPPAAAAILEPGDATELSNRLAEATEEQDICYGWYVSVDDDDGRLSGIDSGSWLGPGKPLVTSQCPRFVLFNARIHYTGSASESPDSAQFEIRSNVPGAPTTSSLRRIGVDSGALLGDRDDQALFNAVAALPALMAEAGAAPPVALEATTDTIPASDRPTGGGGSDRLRTYGAVYGLTALLLVGGAGWIGYALYLRVTARPLRSSD